MRRRESGEIQRKINLLRILKQIVRQTGKFSMCQCLDDELEKAMSKLSSKYIQVQKSVAEVK